MVGAVVDISHLKRQQEELEASRRAAEEARNAQSRFLANISHEIRTPMTGLMGMLDQLLETALDEEQGRLTYFARASATALLALLALLDDVLDYSKLEAGALKVECIPFDLPRLIEEVYALSCAQARTRAVVLGTRVGREPRCL